MRVSLVAPLAALFALPVLAVPSDGLEFLNVKSLAYVETKGMVKDHNNLPISGANVLAIWTGTSYGFHRSNRHCLRIDATTTDTNGQFSIVAPSGTVFRKGLAQQFVGLKIYKRDTQRHISEVGDQDSTPISFADSKTFALGAALQGDLLTERRLTYTLTLYPRTSDVHDRIRYLEELSRLEPDCETKGNSTAVIAFLKAVSIEAESISRSEYERTVAKRIALRINPAFSTLQGGVDPPKITLRWASDPPIPIDTESRNYDDLTPLMVASKEGNLEEVKKLLSLNANPNRTSAAQGLTGGDSALALAIEWRAFRIINRQEGADRFLKVIELILADQRANPNLRNHAQDLTPLMKAIESGQADVVEKLLKAGANPNLTAYNGQYSALGIATKRAISGANSAGVPGSGFKTQFQILLQSKALELNAASGLGDHTALTYAISVANIDVASQLLAAGANPNSPNRANQTPQMVAADMAKWNPGRPEFEAVLKFIRTASEMRSSK